MLSNKLRLCQNYEFDIFQYFLQVTTEKSAGREKFIRKSVFCIIQQGSRIKQPSKPEKSSCLSFQKQKKKKFHTVSKFCIIRFWYPEYLYYLFKNLSDILFLETSRMSQKSVWETTLISFAQVLVFFKCLLSRIKNTKIAILKKVNF